MQYLLICMCLKTLIIHFKYLISYCVLATLMNVLSIKHKLKQKCKKKLFALNTNVLIKNNRLVPSLQKY